MIYECIDWAMQYLTRPMDSLDLQALPNWNKFQLRIQTWLLRGLQQSLCGIIAAMPVGRSHKPEKWDDGGTKFLCLLVDWPSFAEIQVHKMDQKCKVDYVWKFVWFLFIFGSCTMEELYFLTVSCSVIFTPTRSDSCFDWYRLWIIRAASYR